VLAWVGLVLRAPAALDDPAAPVIQTRAQGAQADAPKGA
jgi:hypothetical protein